MAALYRLSIDKKYVLNTIGGSVVNTNIIVSGIVSYNETIRTNADSVLTRALNEKTTPMGLETEYYKCHVIPPTGINFVDYTKILYIWPEIIDSNKTNILEVKTTWNVEMICTSDESAGKVFPVKFIIDDVCAYIYSKYNKTTISFTPTNSNGYDTVDVLKEKLQSCENVLRGLQSFSMIIPTLEKLSSDDLTAKIKSITDSIAVINTQLTTISVGLSA